MSDQRLTEHQSWIGEMVREHQDPLIRYARSIVGDFDNARDVTQETFLRLCRQDRSALAGHEAAWLFRVCHNLALNRIRKEQRMHSTGEAIVDRAPPGPTTDPADPARAASDAEEQRMLWDCIDTLAENQQQVLRLKFHSGMSYRQISESTGLSESNVGYLLHTALKSLRSQMASSEL